VRPNIEEQLQGVCRILEDVIAPELNSRHANETLRNLVANVRMLARNSAQLVPFLRWDNAATQELLQGARNSADAALRERIDSALAGDPAELGDLAALETYNEQLRDCLAACISVGCAADIRAHLRERSARYPMRVTGAQPKVRAAE